MAAATAAGAALFVAIVAFVGLGAEFASAPGTTIGKETASPAGPKPTDDNDDEAEAST